MLSEAQLRRDLQEAMKARDGTTVGVLRGLLASLANRRIEARGAEPSEAELLALVQREVKQRDEALDYARQAGRVDLVEQNGAERAVLERYLPRMLEDGELANLLRSWVAEGVSTIGPLMARLKEGFPGQYDGKRASELAREILSGR